MTVGYFCATPLHILHAVTLQLTTHRETRGELVIYTHFDDAPRMAEALSTLGIFQRVMLYDNHTRTLAGKFHRLWHSLVPDPLIQPWRRDFPYDEAVFFAIDSLTMTWLMAWGRRCRFCYGEDGIGSYINPGLYTPSPVSRLLLTLTGRKKQLKRVAGIYLHRPDLRVTNQALPGIPMEPPAPHHPAMAAVLEALWPVDESAIDTRRRVMYFEEPLSELFGGGAPAVETQLPAMVAAAFGEGQLYIKRHPRMASSASPAALVLPCAAPYERVMGLWEAADTVLLSVISTAALQPLLLAGQRPVMVFLYRLLLPAGHRLRNLWDAFFDKLYQSYELEGRLFIPRSFQELQDVLTALGDKHGLETGNTKE